MTPSRMSAEMDAECETSAWLSHGACISLSCRSALKLYTVGLMTHSVAVPEYEPRRIGRG